MEGRAGADLHGEMLKKGGEKKTNGKIDDIVLFWRMKKKEQMYGYVEVQIAPRVLEENLNIVKTV